MKPRVVTIILAIAVAVMATGGVAAYVSQANSRALAGLKTTTTLVAQQEIAAGTTASAAVAKGLLKSTPEPAAAVPSSAVAKVSGSTGSLVLSSALQPGQLLLSSALVPPGQAATNGALAIPNGMQAVTLPMCLPAAVAGYVQPGAQVAVYDTFVTGTGSVQQNCGDGNASQASSSDVGTRVVLPRAQVLSVSSDTGGQSASRITNADANTEFVTFAVSQDDAERLITLTESGVPYLTLLTASSQSVVSPVAPALFQP